MYNIKPSVKSYNKLDISACTTISSDIIQCKYRKKDMVTLSGLGDFTIEELSLALPRAGECKTFLSLPDNKILAIMGVLPSEGLNASVFVLGSEYLTGKYLQLTALARGIYYEIIEYYGYKKIEADVDPTYRSDSKFVSYFGFKKEKEVVKLGRTWHRWVHLPKQKYHDNIKS